MRETNDNNFYPRRGQLDEWENYGNFMKNILKPFVYVKQTEFMRNSWKEAKYPLETQTIDADKLTSNFVINCRMQQVAMFCNDFDRWWRCNEHVFNKFCIESQCLFDDNWIWIDEPLARPNWWHHALRKANFDQKSRTFLFSNQSWWLKKVFGLKIVENVLIKYPPNFYSFSIKIIDFSWESGTKIGMSNILTIMR